MTSKAPRRVRVLRTLAGLWMLMGVVVAVTEQAATQPLSLTLCSVAPLLAYEAVPIPVRVALWVGTALLAFVASMRLRWQDYGWLALTIMPAERALSHLWSLGHGLIPGEPPGTTWAGIASALLWAGITHLVLIMAGWDEDTPNEGAA